MDPNNSQACCVKLQYLQPKWYGSVKDMLEFATECVRSEKWGGEVPLSMVTAHEMLAGSLDATQEAKYWKQPAVWQSIKAAYEKFARVNPGATHWHNSYARYAYRTGQWAELNRQLASLEKVDYHVFGGKPAFDKILAIARQHAADGGS